MAVELVEDSVAAVDSTAMLCLSGCLIKRSQQSQISLASVVPYQIRITKKNNMTKNDVNHILG